MGYQSTNPKVIPFSKKRWHNDLKQWLDPKWEKKSLLLPEQLEFKPVDVREMKIKPNFIALDTETYESNGNMICLCNSKNIKILSGTPDKLPTIHEVFLYLANLMEDKNTNFICWNLKFDASVILKCMDEETLEKFYYGIEDDKYQIEKDGMNITYLHKKCLTMRYKTRTVRIYDAMQFFLGAGVGGSSSLDNVAKAYLGDQKEYDGKYQDKKFPDKMSNLELRKIIDYCIKDCQLTKQLMDIWVDAFFNNFGFYPTAYFSAGYITSQLFKIQMKTFPSFRKIPFPVQQLAYNAYFGGRFEIMERGKLENIYHYDINSAYPYAMTLLPDFDNGKWVRIRTKEQYHKYRKCVGFYRVHVKVHEENVAPFMFRNEYGSVFCPAGEFETYTTSFELESAENYDYDLIEINGFAFIPKKKGKTEFNKLIENMYLARLKQKNAGQKYVYKVLINSGYGKFAQSKPEPKNLFNPVYCAAITGKCRAMLLDAAKDNKEDIVMFATDGIFSKKPLPVYAPKEKILGAYEGQLHPDMLLVMAGVYSVNDKPGEPLQTKSRGFSLRVFDPKTNEQQQFDLGDYELTLDKKKGSYFYKLHNIRPVAISQAVIQHAYSKNDIGKMIYVRKDIDLNGDHKRVWYDKLKTVYGHNTSRTTVI